MKQLERIFVISLTTICALAALLLADALVAGAVSLVVLLFDKELSAQIFKWGIAVSFGIELLLTVPTSIKAIIKGSD